MASFIQNSAVNNVGLEQQEFDFPTIGLPKIIPIIIFFISTLP